ncbi:hypothetical protein [Streptomyces triticiradicis]|uniref:Uncharacterized protein n=1 Tax=Streptomyces triticiradicis TaxID=2651189 RepID=A0A7J5D715_9ACTN|nr:hypothetical protein [Streptomyces triticiradicis]KAB1981221.1 hypothetical protein F8144_32970 [Streptomyces triticiradicis]
MVPLLLSTRALRVSYAVVVSTDAAGEWLHKSLMDKPDPKVSVERELDPCPEPSQRDRLLESLFGEDATA